MGQSSRHVLFFLRWGGGAREGVEEACNAAVAEIL